MDEIGLMAMATVVLRALASGDQRAMDLIDRLSCETGVGHMECLHRIELMEEGRYHG